MANLQNIWRLVTGGAREEHGDWVVLDLRGGYPTHASSPAQALLQRTDSFEALAARLEQLGRADWVGGVLVRVTQLTAGLATSHAIGRALGVELAKFGCTGRVVQAAA